MNACHVFHFSGDPQLVSMLSRLFGSLSSVLAQTQLGALFALVQYGSDRLRHFFGFAFRERTKVAVR
jgi:hypothetical protein